MVVPCACSSASSGCRRHVPPGTVLPAGVDPAAHRAPPTRGIQVQDKGGRVSPARTFVRHHKLQTDRAVSQAYRRLASDSTARVSFAELLQCARQRSPSILAAPATASHLGVRALFHLARFTPARVRPAAEWPGSPDGWQGAVASLAQHLLGRHRVPRFLASAWYAEESPYAEAARRWFVAHGAGASFRSLDLPLPMTRRMEHIFLASRD